MAIRKRRAVIVAFLVIAMMLVGVGFAAIEGSINIKGEANSGKQDFNVVFIEAKATAINDSQNDGQAASVKVENTKLLVGAEPVVLGSGNGAFTVSMTVENLAVSEDYVTVQFTIQNNNKVAMKLTPAALTTATFNVVGGFVVDGSSELAQSVEVAAEGGKATYSVTVSLKNDAYDEAQKESFTIVINATSDFTPASNG